jgi:hypothetical protein
MCTVGHQAREGAKGTMKPMKQIWLIECVVHRRNRFGFISMDPLDISAMNAFFGKLIKKNSFPNLE